MGRGGVRGMNGGNGGAQLQVQVVGATSKENKLAGQRNRI